MDIIRNKHFPLKEETAAIIKLCLEVHKNLGFGFSEIVYKDAIELEFKQNNIFYEREKEYRVNYKGKILNHYFFADFIVFGSVILEVKAKSGLIEEDMIQALNYLKCSRCKVALIVNFGKTKLELKRVVL